jgi:hypothetical protein
MGVYLDVGVVRIQEYLTRTGGADEHQLRKRRGASLMVAEATAPAAFADLGLEANPESYHVEGVAHLRAGDDLTGDDLAGGAQDLAERAVARTRRALPQAYLRASWAVADTYAAAYPLLVAARTGGRSGPGAGSFDSVPLVREDPFSGRCRSCGLAPSGDAEQCGDCDLRDAQGGGAVGGGNFGGSGGTPRSLALREVSDRAGLTLRPVADLSGLADLPRDRRAKRNHLATVYADGNAVGRLFEGVNDRDTAKRLSVAIDEAIRHAGAQALHGLLAWCDPGVLPAEVTVLAADDALVTVPAPLGWVFVRDLIETFDQAIADTAVIADLMADAQSRGTPLARPSLSAGVVFFHVKSPIETAIQAADAAMRAAKSIHPGRDAIGWTDLTRPPAASAPSRDLDWFRARSGLLDRIADLPAGRSQQWARDIADARAADVPDEELKEFLYAEFNRLGDAVVAEADPTLEELGQMVSIARWWSPPRRREELHAGGPE